MLNLLTHNSVIKELFETREFTSQDGEIISLNSNIRLNYAEALYNTVLDVKPKTVIEIGMAFGVSSLAILTALKELGDGGGKLISVDPFQSTQWKGVGLELIKKAGLESCHQMIEKFDYLALPELLAAGQIVDFAYIDGWHTFDYTLLDFWFIDKMMSVGGVIAFNDCHLMSVTKVIDFVLSHRKYEEINVGLAIEYNDYTLWRNPLKILKGESSERFHRQAQDRYFKKLENWEPDWDFYAKF